MLQEKESNRPPRFRLVDLVAWAGCSGSGREELSQEDQSKDEAFLTGDEAFLASWEPLNCDDVVLDLLLILRWDDDAGSNDFLTRIYTQAAVERINRARRRKHLAPLDTQHCIIVRKYDWTNIKRGILNTIAKCERSNFEKSVLALSRYYHWEYHKSWMRPDEIGYL